MKIVGIDPGGTTGLCVFFTDEAAGGPFFTQLGPEPHHLGLYKFLLRERPDLMICERFDNRGQIAAKLVSGEYIGVAHLVSALHHEYPIHMQGAPEKEWWTNKKLQTIGLYMPGESYKHSMDALRHVLYYLTFKAGDQRWVNRLSG